jgi:GAF domain-containing protein
LLAQFAEKFLAPHETLWIFRCKTLASSGIELPKLTSQLEQFPDRMIPATIQALRQGEFDAVYQRYRYLGWQVSHAEASCEAAAALVGFQMTGLLSIVDEVLAASARPGSKSPLTWKPALAAFAKFHHNCRTSFGLGYMDARQVHSAAAQDSAKSDLAKLRMQQNQEAFLRSVLRNAVNKLNFEDFFPVVARALCESGKYDRVSTALFPANADNPEIFSLSADGKSTVREGFQLKNDCAIRRAVRTREFVIMDEIAPDTACTTCRHLLNEGIRSFAIFPLVIDDRAIGTLNIGSREPHSIRASDFGFLQDLANELAPKVQGAWERSKLIEDLALQRRTTAIVADIHSSLKLEEVILRVCRDLADCFGADRAFLAQINDFEGIAQINHEYLSPQAVSSQVPSAKGIYQLSDFKEAVGLLRKGKVVAADLEGEVHSVVSQPQSILEALKIKTTCWIPVHVFGGFWGVVGVQHCLAVHRWKKPEIEVLQEIARAISSSVEQAQAYQRECDTVDRLERIVQSRPPKEDRP